jgi:3-deoxy-D-manno-octulosonate 8-phosphate phosphatase (KDO 8-P phosphatase)
LIDPELARRIRFVGFDVDGVLTDGGIYLGAVHFPRWLGIGNPKFEQKRYDIQDGIGIEFLRIAGLHTAIVTGRVSESVRHRANELGIEDVAQDPNAMKLIGMQRILEKRNVAWADAAFVADDFPDVPILRKVGLPVCVANAAPEIRGMCRVHLTREGGRGAVREFAELLLKARGEWDRTWNTYVDKRSKT